jgi:hypothetical protein
VAEVFEIRFVVDDGAPPISPVRWASQVRMLILELQPATWARLEGNPPRAIRIASCGGISVAPGLLTQVAALTSTSLHVEGGILEASPDGAV